MLPHGNFSPSDTQQVPAETQVRVNLKDAEDVVCEACGSNIFDMVFLMKKLSALLSPDGTEKVIPIQTIACHKCGHVNENFRPPETEKE